MTDQPHLTAVCVGTPRTVPWRDREVTTAIFKAPVEGRRRVTEPGVEGDTQADPSVHGGADKAVYAYAAADYAWWERRLDRDLAPGTFGENLTVAGLDLREAVVGERWRIGSCVLRVTQPRTPCFKLGIRMGEDRFPARFAAAGRPGTYLAVDEAGQLGAGDPVEVVSRPDHGVTVGLVARAYHDDHGLAARLLAAPELPDGWRSWARRTTGGEPDSAAAGSS